MNKENFKNLLLDLYTIYNPANITYIDDLVERYNNSLEFDAVKNIFIKYNNKKAGYYDKALGTDEHILATIKEYNNGNRTFQGLDLKGNIVNKKVETAKIEKNKAEQIIKEAQNETSLKQDELNKTFAENKSEFDSFVDERKNAFNKEYNEKLTELIEFSKKTFMKIDEASIVQQKIDEIVAPTPPEDNTIIRIFSTYTNTELDLPNKKLLSTLGQGTKIITRDKENKIIGLEITDVSIDFITDPNKPIIEIFVNKA